MTNIDNKIQMQTQTPTPEAVVALKKKIKKLNSKAGQVKMDLHDLAEGLPADYENLIEEARKTYKIYHELAELKQQLKTWEEEL
ncbi:MAG: CCE_0567 family metalloprotein [Chroococcales cyanobacterium]